MFACAISINFKITFEIVSWLYMSLLSKHSFNQCWFKHAPTYQALELCVTEIETPC